MQVTSALAIQALDFAAQIVSDPEQLQRQLDRLALMQLDAADEVERLSRDE